MTPADLTVHMITDGRHRRILIRDFPDVIRLSYEFIGLGNVLRGVSYQGSALFFYDSYGHMARYVWGKDEPELQARLALRVA